MHVNHFSLTQLRGSFSDSFLSANDTPPLSGRIADIFPVSEEHVIIISAQSVHLLYIPQQVFLWSIFVVAPITVAALAPDQPLLALGLPTETLLWDLSTGQIIQRIARPLSEEDGGTIVFGPGGVLAITSLSEGVQLWNIESGLLLHTLIDEEEEYIRAPSLKSMEFSPDGTLLAIGDTDSSPDVLVWRVSDGHVQQTLYGHPWSQRLLGLAFTPDGRYLVGSEWSTDPEEESMPVWDLFSGERIGKLPRMAWLPAISPDGRFIASVNEDSLLLWNLAERRLIWECASNVHERKLLFDPSGRFLLTCSWDGRVQWYTIHDGKKAWTLTSDDLLRIKFASDPSNSQ